MTSKKYPAPVYAAAGAGDYAVEQLRKLPAALTELPGALTELPSTINELPTRLSKLRDQVAPRGDLDLDRLRQSARRNATVALREARSVYAGLVARGERLVEGAGTAVVVREAPQPPVTPVTPEQPAAMPATETVTETAAPTAKATAKPVKRTRPAAGK